VQVYELAARFARVGAGVQTLPMLMKALRPLGLEQHLRDVAFAPISHLDRDWDYGHVTNDLPMPEAFRRAIPAPASSASRTARFRSFRIVLPAKPT